MFLYSAYYIALIACSGGKEAYADNVASKVVLQEKKIYQKISIEDDYDEGCILVVMDKYSSSVNKEQKDLFSKNPMVKSIKDLTYISGNEKECNYLNRDEFRQILKLELTEPSKENVKKAIEQIQEIDGVLSAQVNAFDYPASLPTASSGIYYPSLWGLHGTYGINAEGAWNYSTGSSLVKVGVIDTGIATHDDLNANVTTGWDFVNDNDITNDDPSGHGTHVAGIIGATGANENGVVGVCPEVKLVPLQVVNKNGGWSFEAVAAAITWAISNNIPILNYSGGGNSDNLARKTAISNFDGLFVCSAGNSNSDNNVVGYYPADYSQGQSFSDRVISVGATNISGAKQSNSNYGNVTVSLFAPGESILSTGTNNNYVSSSDTSIAAAFVSGAAALLYFQFVLTPFSLTKADIAKQLKGILMANVTIDSGLSEYCVAGGRLNVQKAFENLPYRKGIVTGFGYNSNWYNWGGRLDLLIDRANAFNLDSTTGAIEITKATEITFGVGTDYVYNAWKEITGTIDFQLTNSSNEVINIEGNSTFTTTVSINLVSFPTFTNKTFTINTNALDNDTYKLTLTCNMTRDGTSYTQTKTYNFVVNKSSCIAEGSLITLADGSQVAVENLTGNENLLVWNMLTGQFDSAPILFIDSDPLYTYEVIKLTFSDGTEVKVIDEHAFFDMSIGEYVFLRKDASQYIGHYFNKKSGDSWTSVQLTNVTIATESTTVWSPVTYSHLCYYVNDMLSMPGATEGFINIFDVDTTIMKYDATEMANDIETYGLYTYEEFNEIIPVPEFIFNAFNGQYLKVSIGKGLITLPEIVALLQKYAKFFN